LSWFSNPKSFEIRKADFNSRLGLIMSLLPVVGLSLLRDSLKVFLFVRGRVIRKTRLFIIFPVEAIQICFNMTKRSISVDMMRFRDISKTHTFALRS